MKKSILSTLLVILIGAGTAVGQQIPMFSSFTINRFIINPSYAGYNGKTNIYGINRIQYAGFAGAPVTFMLTGDAGFKDKKFGFGGMLYSDRNNLIAQNGFQLAYSYNIKLGEKWNLGMGLNAGAVQWTLNFDQLRIDDPSETVLSNYKSNATTFRSDVGFRINSDKFEFGVALPQVVSSKVKYDDYLNNSKGQYASIPHYIANLSYLLSLNENMSLKPMVVVRGAKDVKPQIDAIGLLDWKSKAFATVGYRTGYAVTIGGGVRMGRGVTFGYSYDKPLNDISNYSSGSHEIIVGFTFGEKSAEKPEPANNLSKEAEAKLRADMEKQIQDKLSAEFEAKMKQEIELRINKAVDEKIAKAIESKPASSTVTDGKTSPNTSASLSKEDIEKIKKEIEEKIRKQMDESYTKLIDEKIKKANESKPVVPAAPAQPSKEETEKLRKESEEKIRKEVEDKLRKELSDQINATVQERMDKETARAKDEFQKLPKEYKMTAKDKAMLDSIKTLNLANEKRIADLEKQLKTFPENARVENDQLRDISRIVHQNDIELKKFKEENKVILDKAADPPAKKTDKVETSEEPSKFVLVLACFKTQKEAQQYQKVAAQTFEFPGCKILKPSQLDGWYFVYQKSFDKKKKAWEAYEKIFESQSNTPKYVWIYVLE
jgi:type IX secretion system PorP/SprF family membrane protein